MYNLEYTLQAAKRLDFFCDHDPPIANALSRGLREISDDIGVGKAFGDLDDSVLAEKRIQEALTDAELPTDCRIHWKDVEGPNLPPPLLALVLYLRATGIVAAVGYIPRREAELL